MAKDKEKRALWTEQQEDVLRIDNCDERSDYKEGDNSGLKGAIFINDI